MATLDKDLLIIMSERAARNVVLTFSIEINLTIGT